MNDKLKPLTPNGLLAAEQFAQDFLEYHEFSSESDARLVCQALLQTRAQPEAVSNAGDVEGEGVRPVGVSVALAGIEAWMKCEKYGNQKLDVLKEYLTKLESRTTTAEADLAKAREVIAIYEAALKTADIRFDGVREMLSARGDFSIVTGPSAHAAKAQKEIHDALQSARTWLAANPKMGG